MTQVSATPRAPLWAEIDRVLECLQRAPEDGRARDIAQDHGLASDAELAESLRCDALESIRDAFGLSAFETSLLVLCAGFAMDERFARAAALSGGGRHGIAPTFGMALRILPEPHWSALSPLRPLRHWGLIDVGPGAPLEASLAIDERILHFLLGFASCDDGVDAIIQPLREEELPVGEATEQMRSAVQNAAAHWMLANDTHEPLLLTGTARAERALFFRLLCAEAGLRGWEMDAADLPDTAQDRERLARNISREAMLWPMALLVRTNHIDDDRRLASWLARVSTPVAVEVEAGTPAERLSGLRIETPGLTAESQKAIWRSRLGHLATDMRGSLDALVQTFDMRAAEIARTAETIRLEAQISRRAVPEIAWHTCRSSARRSLDDLAQRVDATAQWEDLILPQAQVDVLRQIIAHAQNNAVVFEQWGFARRYGRGLGLSALFAGASGTGKTMAAGILANELHRDLYQIDLATVVSKYIGETEKHLRRIFDAAEHSGAILLFDEADALFGKRSEVRDSHDRYANLEISYLLQRMEAYRGVAILTSNMQKSLDTAFQRRIRFVVQFPFPEADSRERIWRRMFPAQAPTADLDYARLAQLNVTGGVIRNIALLAAFLAAGAGKPISMRHVLGAARTEYAKLEKTISPAETRGWTA